MGSSKNRFIDFCVLLHGSQEYFCEYLHENENIFKNIFKNILGCWSLAYVLLIHEKTRAQKYHASVFQIVASLLGFLWKTTYEIHHWNDHI